MLNRRHLLATGAGALSLAAVPGPLRAQGERLKIGFVYVGPVGDHGWTYRHDKGRLSVIESLGERVETTFVESVAEGADAERVIRTLAQQGHELIFTTSFGFMNATEKVARRFPQVKFEHCTGYKRLDNMATYNARFYQGRHVIGLIAGRMTQSNTIGYVGSFPIPEVIRGINAFTLAARKVNPEVRTKVVWVNSWYDPGREADAARALIDQGCDIMSQHTDSPAPLTVAGERGIYGFGQASDMSGFAPDAQLTAIIDDWGPYYVERARAVLDGGWASHDVWHGFKEGMVSMAPYNTQALPPEVINEAEAAQKAIVDGALHPFAGPINRQDGSAVIGEGETIADEDLLAMDYYVEGVDGRIPG